MFAFMFLAGLCTLAFPLMGTRTLKRKKEVPEGMVFILLGVIFIIGGVIDLITSVERFV